MTDVPNTPNPRMFPVLFDFDWSRAEGNAAFDPQAGELTLRVRPGGPVWELLADTDPGVRLMSLSFQRVQQELRPIDPRATFLLARIDEEIAAAGTTERRQDELAAMRVTTEMYAHFTSWTDLLRDVHAFTVHKMLLSGMIRPLLKLWSDHRDYDHRWMVS